MGLCLIAGPIPICRDLLHLQRHRTVECTSTMHLGLLPAQVALLTIIYIPPISIMTANASEWIVIGNAPKGSTTWQGLQWVARRGIKSIPIIRTLDKGGVEARQMCIHQATLMGRSNRPQHRRWVVAGDRCRLGCPWLQMERAP